MREMRHVSIAMLTVWLVLCFAPGAVCDVPPGM